MKTKSGAAVAKALWQQWMANYGVPKKIISDGDSTFNNEITKTFRENLGILQHFTIPYVSSGHGKVERPHREYNKQIRKLMDQATWPTLLPLLDYNINSAHNTSMGCSPHQLVFGRTLSLNKLGEMTVKDRWQYFQEWILPYLKTEAQRRQYSMKRSYDKHARVRDYTIHNGQIVYVENKTRRQKFDKLYLGPYIVTEVDEPQGRVKLTSGITGELLQRWVAFDHLKVVKVGHVSELFDVPEDEEFEVVAILDHRRRKGKLEYLCLWRNYPEPTWNLATDMTNCKEILDEYHNLNANFVY
eukprot:Nk52_evm27s2426 gene=Nk52_evmTU27s2426